MKFYAEFKEHIEGLTDVAETVKTIEKVAASSVHTSRIAAEHMSTYREAMEKTLRRLGNFVRFDTHPLLQAHAKGGTVLVILTADRGDVGGLWHNVVEEALEHTTKYTDIFSVGTKGTQYLTERGVASKETFVGFADVVDWDTTKKMSERLSQLFLNGTYHTVDILYSTNKSFTNQVPRITSLFPFTRITSQTDELRSPLGLPVFEPSAQKVFDALLQQYTHTVFVSLVAEAKLAELVARTVAMEHAGAQTEREILRATQQFRRLRRETITNDLLTRFPQTI